MGPIRAYEYDSICDYCGGFLDSGLFHLKADKRDRRGRVGPWDELRDCHIYKKLDRKEW